jgi:hypothetical protein
MFDTTLAVLYAYIGCTLLVAGWLGLHMAFRLDRFDWRFGDVWLGFWLYLLFWPLLLLKPTSVLRPPFRSGPGEIDLAARQRELDGLRRNPPPCGSEIQFVQSGRAGSVLFFPTQVVAETLAANEPEGSRSYGVVESDIVRWVNRRDQSIKGVTEVPAAWWQFASIAADLVRRGHGVARCGACGRQALAGVSMTHRSHAVADQVIEQWACDCNNVLLQVDGARIHRKCPSATV